MEIHLDAERRMGAADALRAPGFDVAARQDPTMAGTDVHLLYAPVPDGRA
jgi:hypothetical protein